MTVQELIEAMQDCYPDIAERRELVVLLPSLDETFGYVEVRQFEEVMVEPPQRLDGAPMYLESTEASPATMRGLALLADERP
jgi:hypothetical protein